MFQDYHPELAPDLAAIYALYAAGAKGLFPLPPEQWEGIFARPDIDPRTDVIIATRQDSDGKAIPMGFCWLYNRPAPPHVYLRGPFLSQQDTRLGEVLDELVREGVRRAEARGALRLDARSLFPAWSEAYARAGLVRMGSYERRRLFPLRGAVAVEEVPAGGEIRSWAGLSDIPILMRLFESSFAAHWDYVPSTRRDFEDVVTGRQFDPRLALFASRKGKPIGYVFGEVMPDSMTLTLEAAYLVSVGVENEYRDMGWGKALLSQWLRAVYDSGLRAVELDVDVENARAIELYTKFGFQMLRREEVWRRDFAGRQVHS